MPLVTKKLIERASEEQVQQIDHYTKRVTDFLTGFNTIKYALAFGTIFTQHNKVSDALYGAQKKNAKIENLTAAVSYALNDLSYVGSWLVGAVLVQRGQMGFGQLVAFANLVGFLTWPMTSMTTRLPTLIGGAKAATVIREFLAAPVTGTAATHQVSMQPALASFAHANFMPDGKPVLQDINLNLASDKKYLMVGASGSGKSTLVQMLLGEIQPTNGHVQLLGEAASSLARADVYGNVGLLAQKGYIFTGTVRDNVTLFAPTYSDAAIETALVRAGLASWLAKHSLDTPISDRGPELSGGEKQRLSVARLFLRGYNFFCFDELTTGLDPHIADALLRDIYEFKVH